MNRLFFSLPIIFLAAACSPAVHRGSVAMKISDNEAHVCMGSIDVAPGDTITIYRNVCKRDSLDPSKTSQRTPSTLCDKKQIGRGKITSVLNSHYSVATVEAGTVFEEGDIVEKGDS